MRFQKRIPGLTRENVNARVVPQIKAKLEKLAVRFDCSKSFVQNTILAEALGIEQEEKYYVVEAGRARKGHKPHARRKSA